MANNFTRRQALGATAALLGAPAIVRQANAQSRFDWKRFAGERIEVTLQTSPRGLLLQRNNKEFEDLTGIRCGIEVVPEQQHRQKIIVEYASGRPSFDVAELSLHVNKRQVGKAKWNTDIKALIADASITAPDFDFADFGAGMVQYATQSDGRMDSLPAFADYFILYYNKDLFAAKNIAVPTTWDGMYEAAKALTDPSRQIYGHVGRGLKNANVVLWSSYLLGTGQRDMINANRQLITDTDDAVWAGEMYKKFLRDVSPPGSIGLIGMNAKPPSCRAARPCGLMALALRHPWKIASGPAWRARLAMRWCQRGAALITIAACSVRAMAFLKRRARKGRLGFTCNGLWVRKTSFAC
jgi:multiple sugar transport system substrate-binding protein